MIEAKNFKIANEDVEGVIENGQFYFCASLLFEEWYGLFDQVIAIKSGWA